VRRAQRPPRQWCVVLGFTGSPLVEVRRLLKVWCVVDGYGGLVRVVLQGRVRTGDAGVTCASSRSSTVILVGRGSHGGVTGSRQWGSRSALAAFWLVVFVVAVLPPPPSLSVPFCSGVHPVVVCRLCQLHVGGLPSVLGIPLLARVPLLMSWCIGVSLKLSSILMQNVQGTILKKKYILSTR
jgi:hypothetical protein